MAFTARHTVATLVPDGAQFFELAVVHEVFGVDRSYLADPWYELRLCAEGPLRTQAGLVLDAPRGLDAALDADTVVVVPGPEEAGPSSPRVLETLREAHRRGARVASICTAAFVLAEAGLLEGRRATTHWTRAGELAERYPGVEVDPNVLYVQDGAVFTSAGTASGVDLCLHLVRLDHGAEVANGVARMMVVPPHRDGGQAQYVDAPVPRSEAGHLAALLDWAVEHLDSPLTLDDLARQANLSTRTLARRFQEATGGTPLQWLQGQRLRLAQRLLEATDLPIELVASRSGFGTAANLRQHFARSVGVAPLHYRRTFRGEQSAGVA